MRGYSGSRKLSFLPWCSILVYFPGLTSVGNETCIKPIDAGDEFTKSLQNKSLNALAVNKLLMIDPHFSAKRYRRPHTATSTLFYQMRTRPSEQVTLINHFHPIIGEHLLQVTKQWSPDGKSSIKSQHVTSPSEPLPSQSINTTPKTSIKTSRLRVLTHVRLDDLTLHHLTIGDVEQWFLIKKQSWMIINACACTSACGKG